MDYSTQHSGQNSRSMDHAPIFEHQISFVYGECPDLCHPLSDRNWRPVYRLPSLHSLTYPAGLSTRCHVVQSILNEVGPPENIMYTQLVPHQLGNRQLAIAILVPHLCSRSCQSPI